MPSRAILSKLVIMLVIGILMPVYGLSCGGGSDDDDGGSVGGSEPPYIEWEYGDTIMMSRISDPDNDYSFSSPAVVSYTWAAIFDADSAWMDDRADKIKSSGYGLYKATEGNFQFGTQTFTDGSAAGNMVITSYDTWYAIEGHNITGYFSGAGYYSGYIGLCGKWQSDIFLHEYRHAKLGRFDRAAYEEYGCSICVMGTYQKTRTTQLNHYCYSGDCRDNPSKNCWDYEITANFPNLHRTGSNPGNGPSISVTITNN